MRKQVIRSLYRKELLDILRDKKTILMMIVIPLILYPLIFVGSMLLASSVLTASTSRSYRVGFEGLSDTDAMEAFFESHKEAHHYSFIYYRPDTPEDHEKLLRDKKIDTYLTESVSENRPSYHIVYLASETESKTAADMLRDILMDYRDELRDRAIAEAGLDAEELLNPILFEYEDKSTREESAGYFVGMIIPFLLITSILMGAVYPAIDTTAGEKERGTLETLLTLPVKNLELIIAKFLATSTVAVSAALLNILSMLLLGIFMADSMLNIGSSGMDLASFIPAAFITLLCVMVFAMFAAAVCLTACIFARSFKEAQNMTTPVLLVFMIGGMAGMIPQLKLTPVTALIPVANVSLLIGEIFRFRFEISQILMVLVSNLAYTGIAVVLMTRFFSSENILFGDASSGMKLLESRKDMKKGQIPGIGDVVLLFSMLLLVMLFAGSSAVLHYGLFGVALQQLLMLGLTLFYAWYIRSDGRKLFKLKAPRPAAVGAGLLCWLGLYLICQVWGTFITELFPSISMENTEALVSLWEGQSIWFLILVIALLPAVCEELIFRGFLLAALEKRFRPAAAVILCGSFFALYHMSLLQFLVLLPLGLFFSYIAWKEGSIWPGVIFHFLNNLSAVLLQENRKAIADRLPSVAGDVPTVYGQLLLLFTGIVLFAGGTVLLHIGKARKKA
ncbi:MAG: ABC transporter permease subunit [Lachnospiraceae bacterium]|nr:ABC transporter permease subunit [Lachnospiraceae bacterium]